MAHYPLDRNLREITALFEKATDLIWPNTYAAHAGLHLEMNRNLFLGLSCCFSKTPHLIQRAHNRFDVVSDKILTIFR